MSGRMTVEALRGEQLVDRHLLRLLLPLFTLAWLIQRYLLPFLSSWLPLLLAAWATFQYGRYKHNLLLEDPNSRWKRQILYNSPKTPLEPCEWVNKLITKLWPNYIEKRLSQMFSTIMMKRLKEKRPQPFRSIELQEFFLGVSAPIVGMQRTYWTNELVEQALHMGFEWETSGMRVILAVTLAGPFKGVARFVINSLYIKGDLRIVPVLDGQAFLYSFVTRPEIRIGLAFGGGQSDPATELPPAIATWLEKLFMDTLMRTMVEPQRRCFPLSAVSLKKRAIGGVVCIAVLSAKNLHQKPNAKGHIESSSASEGSSSRPMATFVDVTLEGVTRSTQMLVHNGFPIWNHNFNMILHESAGTVSFKVYDQGSSNVKYDSCGSCEAKIRYVDDGSTIFWSNDSGNRVLAYRAENCGKEVQMELPIRGHDNAKLCVGLLVKEWQFTDGSRIGSDARNVNHSNILQSLPSFEALTGRILRVTVMEGRYLAAKDRTGKSDPYVRLRYGKVQRKTNIVKQDLNPVWRQSFDFPELQHGDHLRLKCFDADYFNDENLGSACVNLEGMEDGVVRDVWIPLEKIHTGEIRLLIEASTSESWAESSQTDTRRKPSLDLQKGILEVMVVEARDLVAADLRGSSDPFVVLHCGNQKQLSKVVHKTLHPQWNQTFEIVDSGQPLILSVKDHNAILPNVSIGRCVVEYERLPQNQVVDKWIPLQGVRKGEIHVQVIRRPPRVQSSVAQSSSNRRLITDSKISQKSHQVQALLKQVLVLSQAKNTDAIGKKLEEIELVEAEKSLCLSRLLRERELLLAKIQDLRHVLKDNDSGLQSA